MQAYKENRAGRGSKDWRWWSHGSLDSRSHFVWWPELCPLQNSYAEVLTPYTWECGWILRQDLQAIVISFPGGTSGKEPAYQCRRCKRCGLDPWVRKIPRRRAWQVTPVFLPGESHGQKSLMGHSPVDHKKSDTTEATEHGCKLKWVHSGGPYSNLTGFLKKKRLRPRHTQGEAHVKTQGEDNHLQATERGLKRNWHGWHLHPWRHCFCCCCFNTVKTFIFGISQLDSV